MIAPYNVAVCQMDRIVGLSRGLEHTKEVARENLKRYCEVIDFTCAGEFSGRGPVASAEGVRLLTFGEFSITGNQLAARPGEKTLTNREIIKYIAISIPGEETDILAAKARQYGVYIAAANLELDPAWPDLHFNTGFIISPKGKIILKYRKIVTNNLLAISCSAHDVMDQYKDPITGKYDPFPVVDTEIGRLAVFICADLIAPEIPRIYSMKGADVVLHLTSGMSAKSGGMQPNDVNAAALRTRAWDNCVYIVNSNWGLELGGYYPKVRISGGSCVFDYAGNLLAAAQDCNEQVVRASIDVEACRKARAQYFRNSTSIIRTELYAPFYNQTIYPPNMALKEGPLDELLNERQQGRIRAAKENLKRLEGFYSEDIVR